MRAIDYNIIANVAFNTREVAVDVNGDPAARGRNRWLTAGVTYDDTIAGVSVIT